MFNMLQYWLLVLASLSVHDLYNKNAKIPFSDEVLKFDFDNAGNAEAAAFMKSWNIEKSVLQQGMCYFPKGSFGFTGIQISSSEDGSLCLYFSPRISKWGLWSNTNPDDGSQVPKIYPNVSAALPGPPLCTNTAYCPHGMVKVSMPAGICSTLLTSTAAHLWKVRDGLNDVKSGNSA